MPVRERYRGAGGWRLADLREDPGEFSLLFVDVRPDVLARYGRTLLAGGRWLQRETKYAGVTDEALEAVLAELEDGGAARMAARGGSGAARAAASDDARLAARFVADVREEYFSVLGHLLDSRYYRTHDDPGRPAPAGKYSAKTARLCGLHGPGPGRHQDLGLDPHHPGVLRSRRASGSAIRGRPRRRRAFAGRR